MKARPSLRLRMVQVVGGGLLVLLMSLYLVAVMELDERQEEMIDAVLHEQMRYTVALYHESGRLLAPNVPRVFFYHFPVTQPAANLPAAFRPFGPGNHETDIGNTEYHLVVHDENGERFVLAHDVEKFEEGFTSLMVALGVTMALAAIMIMVCIHWLSGRVLGNLTQLARDVQQRREHLLTHPDMESEVFALAQTLDDYRARQAQLLARERDFSGHLSHELRTPLSVIRGQAEMLILQHPHDIGVVTRAQAVIQQADRMRSLIEQMLRLARREQAGSQREHVALRPLVDRLWQELSHDGSSQTTLLNQLLPDTVLAADSLLLELILRNALANARQHADGAELRVHFDGHSLHVEDFSPSCHGLPTLPDDAHEGLGLSILRRACALMGWSCTLTPLPTGLRLSLTPA